MTEDKLAPENDSPPSANLADEKIEERTEEQLPVVSHDHLPDKLLVIPLRDRPMFPKMMGPLVLEEPALQREIIEYSDKSLPLYLGLILVRPNDDALVQTPTSGHDFFGVGTVVRVLQASPLKPGEPLHMVAQALKRFDARLITKKDEIFYVEPNYWQEETTENTAEMKAYEVAIIDCIKELVTLNPLFKEGLSLLIERINLSDPSALADFSASMTTSSGAEIQKVLETRDIQERLETSLVLLKKELEITRLKSQISKRIEERLSKQQREFFLKQQLQEIKQELGIAKDDTQAELKKYEERLKKLVLTDEARERVQEEMDKLKLLGPSSPEFGVARTYLDWLTILPWGVYGKESYDLDKARKILERDHWGLEDVKERILELISVGIIKGDLSGSIILLVGPPGVGKTSVGQSIAKSLGRKFYRFSLGGMRDEAEIKGHRRTYIGAMPGKFIQAIKTCKTANPVIMLDEIDKIGASFHGDPASALLEVLDPEQNRDFLDHYLDVRFDLSKVLFIVTANQLDTIPGPLLDRMEIIQLPGYILQEKVEIARRHLLPKQLKLHGLSAKQVHIGKAILAAIVDGWAREAGMRGLENCLKKIIRKSARRIVENPGQEVRIGKNELTDLLGKRIFSEGDAYKKPRVGVVRGLAYTSMGGTTLYIEAIPVPTGQAGYKQTGQLGQVMVESSEIAYTYVRSFLKKDKEATEFFAKNFIHLHVPAGATPKDGPSAGITMACALYSLVKGKTIIPDLAMTGELTLSGLVMPIGGVKEKVLAAKRSDVKIILLPKENQGDFDLLPKHVREGITPHFIGDFHDMLQVCFP